MHVHFSDQLYSQFMYIASVQYIDFSRLHYLKANVGVPLSFLISTNIVKSVSSDAAITDFSGWLVVIGRYD